jgi:hypothetical protein
MNRLAQARRGRHARAFCEMPSSRQPSEARLDFSEGYNFSKASVVGLLRRFF